MSAATPGETWDQRVLEAQARAAAAPRVSEEQWAGIVDQVESRRATITPAPKGKLTRKWKAYVVLGLIWFVALVVSLFFPIESAGYQVARSTSVSALTALALFVLRPPVQWKEGSK